MSKQYIVNYHEYERHSTRAPRPKAINGNTLGEALLQLPKAILKDVFMNVEEDGTDDHIKTFLTTSTDEEIIEHLNDIDVGGFSYLNVFHNDELIAGFDDEE